MGKLWENYLLHLSDAPASDALWSIAHHRINKEKLAKKYEKLMLTYVTAHYATI